MWWLWLVAGAVVSAAGSVVNDSIGGPGEAVESALQRRGLDDPISEYNALSPFPYYSSGTQHFVSPSFPEIDSRGFYGGVFEGIGDHYPSWPSFYYNRIQKSDWKDNPEGLQRNKRSSNASLSKEMSNGKNLESSVGKTSSNDVANVFSVAKRGRSGGRRIIRGMEMGSSGFHDDIFNSGFGDFYTMKRSLRAEDVGAGEPLVDGSTLAVKRRPEMDAMGFHGDTFGGGFGEFETMKKKRRPEMDAMGFHGDTFGGGFGEFDTMKKRKTDNTKSFRGDFRRNWPDALGFYGDMLGYRFGDFDVLKKRAPEMSAMGFHGDMFNGGFGEFDTMKKRFSSHGESSKINVANLLPNSELIEKLSRPTSHFRQHLTKRRPEMDSMGFHGGMFSQGFGDFETMKRSARSVHGSEKI